MELEGDAHAVSGKGVATSTSINTSYKRLVNYLEELQAEISSHRCGKEREGFLEARCCMATRFRPHSTVYLNTAIVFREKYIIKN